VNTLSNAHTRAFFRDAAGRCQLQKRWSELVNSDARASLTAAHFFLYLALLGKDWRRAFTPITNQRKLDNGGVYDWGLVRALRGLRAQWYRDELLAPFGDLISSEVVDAVAALLPASALELGDAYEVAEVADAA
jgi:hypothetical protein